MRPIWRSLLIITLIAALPMTSVCAPSIQRRPTP